MQLYSMNNGENRWRTAGRLYVYSSFNCIEKNKINTSFGNSPHVSKISPKCRKAFIIKKERFHDIPQTYRFCASLLSYFNISLVFFLYHIPRIWSLQDNILHLHSFFYKFFLLRQGRLRDASGTPQGRLPPWDLLLIHSHISWPRSGDCGGSRIRTMVHICIVEQV
jgi:hypothetical protein